MECLLDLVLEKVPGPEVQPDAPLQMLVTTVDWSQYVGRIGVGRITSGTLRSGQRIGLSRADGEISPAQISSLMVFHNLGRTEVPEAQAGEIVAVVGLDDIEIGDTICDLERPRAMPRLVVDEPTLEMVFTINSSPLSGRDGKYVTSTPASRTGAKRGLAGGSLGGDGWFCSSGAGRPAFSRVD
jgi:GTP-binding protein